ncbi:MAG: DTW domain-containing protein [Deltaproteobacteria bacterium]|nr:DTW domain-containing protein [Deltaproteobacteria bacterium]
MMRDEHCLCAECDLARSRLATSTRLVLVIHFRELRTTTNTGRLACLALPDAELRVRGREGAPLRTDDLFEPGRRTLVLFPSEAADDLTPEFAARNPGPYTLVVPDGNWSQSRRTARRLGRLDAPDGARVQFVRLPQAAPSRYALRHEPAPDGLATCEAIARALGVLDGAGPQRELERVFELMVERTLATRGLFPS